MGVVCAVDVAAAVALPIRALTGPFLLPGTRYHQHGWPYLALPEVLLRFG
jgi:hypothetical protein